MVKDQNAITCEKIIRGNLDIFKIKGTIQKKKSCLENTQNIGIF